MLMLIQHLVAKVLQQRMWLHHFHLRLLLHHTHQVWTLIGHMNMSHYGRRRVPQTLVKVVTVTGQIIHHNHLFTITMFTKTVGSIMHHHHHQKTITRIKHSTFIRKVEDTALTLPYHILHITHLTTMRRTTSMPKLIPMKCTWTTMICRNVASQKKCKWEPHCLGTHPRLIKEGEKIRKENFQL